MKKSIFLVFLLFAVVFNSCTKDDPLDREKFIGSWTGTMTTVTRFNGTVYENSSEMTTETFDAGADPDLILIGKNTDNELKATVSGSSFVIKNQAKFIRMSDGTNLEVAVTGNGVLSASGVLTMSYSAEGVYKNVTISATTSGSLNKD